MWESFVLFCHVLSIISDFTHHWVDIFAKGAALQEWFLSHTSPVEVPQEVPTAWDGICRGRMQRISTVLFELPSGEERHFSLPKADNFSLKKMPSPKLRIFPELIQNSSRFDQLRKPHWVDRKDKHLSNDAVMISVCVNH